MIKLISAINFWKPITEKYLNKHPYITIVKEQLNDTL